MSRPPVFQELTFDAASERAAVEHRLLLIDVTATWCGPCRQMDATTWVAGDVVQWLEQRTIAIQIDADSEHAKRFRVQAVPTLIVLRNGQELDRVTGSKTPAALLEWLDGLEKGTTELDRLRASPRTNLRARLALARALVERGLDGEAADEFAWLWEHALEVDPAWVGVRYSFLVAALAPLIQRSAQARQRFAELRDAVEKDIREGTFTDWATLNWMLGDERRVLQWLETSEPSTIHRVGATETQITLTIVERHQAWATLGRAFDDPVEALRRVHERVSEQLDQLGKSPTFPEHMRAEVTQFLGDMVRSRASMLVRALTAANRTSEAEAVAAAARQLDPSPEMEAALSGKAQSPGTENSRT